MKKICKNCKWWKSNLLTKNYKGEDRIVDFVGWCEANLHRVRMTGGKETCEGYSPKLR